MANKEEALRAMQKCFHTLNTGEDNTTEQQLSRHRQVSLDESINLPCFFTDEPEEPQLCSVIKTGWLDKTPPQGSLLYQKRWVQLDSEYLRYFQNNKEVYSKRMIALCSVTAVISSGEQKFEVVTKNRTFLFRAESSMERTEWVTALRDTLQQHSRESVTGSIAISDFQSPTAETHTPTHSPTAETHTPTHSPTAETRTPSHGSTERSAENLFFNGKRPVVDAEGCLEMTGLRSKLYLLISQDKVYLFRNCEEYLQGVGITAIDMKMGSVRDKEKRTFNITTLYRTFSFVAESEQQKQEWLVSLQGCVSRSLSCDTVAQRIWKVEGNRSCADCCTACPEWASVNLCVVLCELCAGVHRGLGQSVSKVRSLKMDERVWTDDLIQVFLLLGNSRANLFWAANVPPSEVLSPCSDTEDRRCYISAKYNEGKYRLYHALYGQQGALNNALCSVVQTADVLETLSLLFCGAEINCYTGIPECPSPVSLAQHSGQTLQAELLTQNQHTGIYTETPGSKGKAPPTIAHSGYLFKTASSSRPITERKARGDFSRRWCHLSDGLLSYYKNEMSSSQSGGVKTSDIVCLAINSPGKHGYEHSFELYSESGRLYLFGADDRDTIAEWITLIAKSVVPAGREDMGRLCERLGRLRCADGMSRDSSGLGWFCLSGVRLQVLLQGRDTVENIDLRKLHRLTMPDSSGGSLVLVWKGRTLRLEWDRRLHFPGWLSSIQQASGKGDQSLCQQQLSDAGIPLTVHRCLDHITRHGLISAGIYRKNGVHSKVSALLECFRDDARRVCVRAEDYGVDDVASTLKRFLREVREGLFSGQHIAQQWLNSTDIEETSQRIGYHQSLLQKLPTVNRETLKALLNHLHCVQHFSDHNQMTRHNLAIVFGPTLFQTDGTDPSAARVVEDMIQNYTAIFNVTEAELQKQMNMTSLILEDYTLQKMPNTPSCTICAVYLEQKEEGAELLVQIPVGMTAAELVCEVLNRRKISTKQDEFWSCYQIDQKEEMERVLHHQERVLPLYCSLSPQCHLLVRKNYHIKHMITYLVGMGDVSKRGALRVCEVKGERGRGSFCSRYCVLASASLRLYKEKRSAQPERAWPVESLTIYQGYRRKLQPPTPWGMTLVCEAERQDKQQWYLCCESEDELTEWTAIFLSIQHDGNVWPPAQSMVE